MFYINLFIKLLLFSTVICKISFSKSADANSSPVSARPRSAMPSQKKILPTPPPPSPSEKHLLRPGWFTFTSILTAYQGELYIFCEVNTLQAASKLLFDNDQTFGCVLASLISTVWDQRGPNVKNNMMCGQPISKNWLLNLGKQQYFNRSNLRKKFNLNLNKMAVLSWNLLRPPTE